MDKTECSWCSREIKDGGIPFKGKIFCCDDCLCEWKEDNSTPDNTDFTRLDEDLMVEGRIVEEDLDLDDDITPFEGGF